MPFAVAFDTVSLLCRPPCQLYVPRLPGIPNDYPYFPDAFHLAFEDVELVSQLGCMLFSMPGSCSMLLLSFHMLPPALPGRRRCGLRLHAWLMRFLIQTATCLPFLLSWSRRRGTACACTPG